MNKNFLGNFKKRDIIVILVTIVAVAGLFIAVRATRQQERNDQIQLVENSAEETSQETASVKTSTKSYLEKVLINEITNDGVIELYNTASRSLNIGGYKIYVGTELISTIPDDAAIDAKGLFTVETKKSFKNTDSNVVKLYDSKDQLVRAVTFDAIPAGSSFGSLTDGSYEAGMITSTVGETNNGSTRVDSGKLVMSVPGGFYEDAFSLELSAPEGCKIYYTLDSTAPTTESTEYTGKLTISRPSGSSYTYAVSDGKGYTYTKYVPSNVDMGMVVRAIAVNAKGETVDSQTAAYYIGFTEDSSYVGLPVISLEVDPDEMFGFETGIYVPGKSYYDGYIQGDTFRGNFLRKDSAAHGQIEYYETTKDRTYSADVAVSIYNDARRHAEQKSLVVTPVSEYPEGTSLDGFCNEGYKSFLLLSGGWDNNFKARNMVVNSMLDGTTVITRDYSPCIVFINGEYWGLYILANEFNSDYFKSKYDIADSMITITSDYVGSQSYQEFYNYVVNTDFTVPMNYDIVKTMMDVPNYIEFMCTNILIGNTRLFSNYSACVFKTVHNTGTGYSDGRWRWALNNVEYTMANPSSAVDEQTSGNYSSAIMNTYLSHGIKDNAFFNSLLQNDSFAEEFMTTMDSLLVNNFTQEHAEAALKEIEDSLSKAATESMKRYAKIDNKQYALEVERIRTFFENREHYLRIYTEEYIGQKGDVAAIYEDAEATSEASTAEGE